MKKIILLLTFCFTALLPQMLSAEPSETGFGKYVRLGDLAGGGFQFKCNWQIWNHCYTYESSIPMAYFGDGTWCECYVFSLGPISEPGGQTSEKYEAIPVN